VFLLLLAVASSACCLPRKVPAAPQVDDSAQTGDQAASFASFLADFEHRLAADSKAASAAWWEAANTGDKDAFARLEQAELALKTLHSDPATYDKLEKLRTSGSVSEPIQRRTLDVLYLAFRENQIPPDLNRQLVEASTGLEQAFNSFRAQVGGNSVTANQIQKVLLESDDSAERQRHWQASKEVGPLIEKRLRALVAKRNRAARALGYDNFYAMRLDLQEQDPARIKAIFDEIDAATAPLFDEIKASLDQRLSKRFGITPAELRPWHYGDVFFQETPAMEGLDLNPTFAKVDQLAVAEGYFRGIGLAGTREILDRSDLYERKGKVEHAFCADIDREGDIRILANLQRDEMWTSVLLHELGHCLYDAYIDKKLPFALRKSAHALVTEGVAQLFGALTRDPVWLAEYTDLDAETRARVASSKQQQTRLRGVIFARWSLVVLHFERALYTNPEQDLNQLWWDLVRRYQKLTPPDSLQGRSDWATKIHLVTVPAYYHNYLLGELFAAQLRNAIAKAIPGSEIDGAPALVCRPEVGAFFIEKIFAPGRRYPWEELVRRATGERLSAAAFLAGLRD